MSGRNEDRDETPPAEAPEDWAAQLLTFWFERHGPAKWFGGGPEFDAEVREGFADWRDTLRSRPHADFMEGAATALAAIILFDQVPRNVYRGHAEAFATDPLALAIAREAVARGYDDALAPDQRLFMYLPFEHSEDMDDQRESLRLFTALGNDGWLDYARHHYEVIERFGRFPHRNAALGRKDRPGEAEAVAQGASW